MEEIFSLFLTRDISIVYFRATVHRDGYKIKEKESNLPHDFFNETFNNLTNVYILRQIFAYAHMRAHITI